MECLQGGGAPYKYLDKIVKCIKRSMRTMLFKKLLTKKHPDSIIEQFPLHFNEAANNINSKKLVINTLL